METSGRQELKAKFKNGCIPSEKDYEALIDASLNLYDDKALFEPEDSLSHANKADSCRVTSTLNKKSQTPPESELKLYSNNLTFGGVNKGRQIDSAQISAGYLIKNSLNIVGMAANTDAATRRIDMWAEAGMYLYTSALHVGGPVYSHGINVSKEVANHLEADGAFYRYRGQAYLTVDDNFYIRDQNSDIKFFFDTNGSRLSIGVQNNGHAQVSLGAWDAGPSGPATDGSTQLLLSGKHNEGINKGGRNGTYKLKIEGYDNDGANVYPIHCMDENSNVDFWIKNRKSDKELPTAFFAGYVQQQSCAFSGKYTKDAMAGDAPALEFDQTLLNEGNHFHGNRFVVPINGIYQITLDVFAYPDDDSDFRWWLMQNDETVYGEPPQEGAEACLEINPGNNCRTFLVKLFKGRQVYIKQQGMGRMVVSNCGFSGSLVSALV